MTSVFGATSTAVSPSRKSDRSSRLSSSLQSSVAETAGLSLRMRT